MGGDIKLLLWGLWIGCWCCTSRPVVCMLLRHVSFLL